jgi:hypothetical protein
MKTSLAKQSMPAAVVVALGLTAAPRDAGACDWVPESASVQWPTADATGVPTDTRVWILEDLELDGAFAASLVDASGAEVPTTRSAEPYYDPVRHGGSSTSGVRWITLTPDAPLAPDATYEVWLDFTPPAAEPTRTSTVAFTTGAGPLDAPAPGVDGASYFTVENVPASEIVYCSPGVVPTTTHLTRAEGVTPAASPLRVTFTYAIDGYEPMSVPTMSTSGEAALGKHSPEADASPCVTVTVTDVIGRSATSDPVCQPAGCFGHYEQAVDDPDGWRATQGDPASWDAASGECGTFRATYGVEDDPPEPSGEREDAACATASRHGAPHRLPLTLVAFMGAFVLWGVRRGRKG